MAKIILVLFASALALAGAATDVVKHPNIIVLLSDDQGWGDLRSSGNTDISTPNIDSLARDGASFDL